MPKLVWAVSRWAVLVGVGSLLPGPAPGNPPSTAAPLAAIHQTAEEGPDLIPALRSSKEVAFLETVTITVTVRNAGTQTAPESSCEIVIRNGRPPQQLLRKFEKKVRELAPGDAYTFSTPLKPGFGLYEVCAAVDPAGKIRETDETNNRICIKITGK
jgi:subtilase family serine protease